MKPHHALLLIAALWLLAIFTGCTTVRENGKTVFLTGANAGHLVYRSPTGSYLEITALDHAIIHKTIGGAIGQSALSLGTAIATSGIVPAVKP